jgi:hypothetical protein
VLNAVATFGLEVIARAIVDRLAQDAVEALSLAPRTLRG